MHSSPAPSGRLFLLTSAKVFLFLVRKFHNNKGKRLPVDPISDSLDK